MTYSPCRVAGQLDDFLSAWWPRLQPGALLLVHSTLTNTVTRSWLEQMRARARRGVDGEQGPKQGSGKGAAGVSDQGADGGEEASLDPLGGDALETLSLLEPHKRVQNSVSIFQKRPSGWGEPIHTTYP